MTSKARNANQHPTESEGDEKGGQGGPKLPREPPAAGPMKGLGNDKTGGQGGGEGDDSDDPPAR